MTTLWAIGNEMMTDDGALYASSQVRKISDTEVVCEYDSILSPVEFIIIFGKMVPAGTQGFLEFDVSGYPLTPNGTEIVLTADGATMPTKITGNGHYTGSFITPQDRDRIGFRYGGKTVMPVGIHITMSNISVREAILAARDDGELHAKENDA